MHMRVAAYIRQVIAMGLRTLNNMQDNVAFVQIRLLNTYRKKTIKLPFFGVLWLPRVQSQLFNSLLDVYRYFSR